MGQLIKILLLPDESSKIVHEIVRLCYQRNFIFNCLYGDSALEVFSQLSPLAVNVLRESGFFPKGYKSDDNNKIKLKLDGLIAEGIVDNLSSLSGKPSIFNLTQIMQMYRGRYQLKPITAHGSLGQSNRISEANLVNSSSLV